MQRRRVLLAATALAGLRGIAGTVFCPSDAIAQPAPAGPAGLVKLQRGPWAGSTSYIGPGDIVSGATAWYGLRAYNAAALSGTQKAINIRRASDQATADILVLPNGKLDVATATTFLAATTGYVTTWYDQSGNGNHAVQATPANQPQLMLTGGSNNLPHIAFDGGGTRQLTVTVGSAPAQPYSTSAIGIRTGYFTGQNIYLLGSYTSIGWEALAGTALDYAGSSLDVPVTDQAWHSLISVNNGASSAVVVDGAATSGNAGSHQFSATAVSIGSNGFAFRLAELAIWPVGFSAPQYAALHANQSAYWGTA
jgi:hypothetical protein